MAFVHQDLVQRAQHPPRLLLGQHERAPRDAQAHAQRGLVGAVAADVADDDLEGAVGQPHRVEEVAAQQHPAAAGPVAGLQGQVLAVHDRRGQQAAFQAGLLGGVQLLVAQLAGGLLGVLALHGVADAAHQQRAVDLVLHQVVLGTGRDGHGALALVGEAGQHEDRGGGGEREQPAQPVQAGGVRQPEVEQYAVGVRQELLGLLETARTGQLDQRVHFLQERFDQHGVTFVVLDEQHAHRSGRDHDLIRFGEAGHERGE